MDFNHEDDFYGVLGAERNEDLTSIRRKYYRLMLVVPSSILKCSITQINA